MKIEKKEKPFEPVTITLETQDELDFLYQVMRLVGGEVGAELFGSASAPASNLVGVGAKIREEWVVKFKPGTEEIRFDFIKQ